MFRVTVAGGPQAVSGSDHGTVPGAPSRDPVCRDIAGPDVDGIEWALQLASHLNGFEPKTAANRIGLQRAVRDHEHRAALLDRPPNTAFQRAGRAIAVRAPEYQLTSGSSMKLSGQGRERRTRSSAISVVPGMASINASRPRSVRPVHEPQGGLFAVDVLDAGDFEITRPQHTQPGEQRREGSEPSRLASGPIEP